MTLTAQTDYPIVELRPNEMLTISIYGTWNGATVALQFLDHGGTWRTAASYTADAFFTASSHTGQMRFSVSGANPTLQATVSKHGGSFQVQ